MRQWLSTTVLRVALVPFDLVLRALAARYRLFVLFFRIVPPSFIARIAVLRGMRAADRAYRRVPAYRQFVNSHAGTAIDVSRMAVPSTDKENYISVFPHQQRCVDGRVPLRDTSTDESSGSTGTPFNWVRSLDERRSSHVFVSHFARYCFGDEPWITINAFSLGSWATGINMGIALQSNSMVKNTGPDMDKIFSTLDFFGPRNRFLVCGYPPFLKHMIDAAGERRFPLEKYRLMALLGGEGNSEGLRDYLSRRFSPVYSGYGATDIEIGIAGETPVCLAIRREARTNADLRAALFGEDPRLPMLFQYNPLMHHIEVNAQGELLFTITRLNVLAPRIRYNIHDEGGVASYADLVSRALRAGIDLLDLARRSNMRPMLLPFLWVYGRKDSTISVMGANIYPEDIEQCLYDEPELARLTHSFCLGLDEGRGTDIRPVFSFEVSTDITSELQQMFDRRIPARLKALNADYRVAAVEYEASTTPMIRLFPLGSGPFSSDSSRIKQVRIVRNPAGAEGRVAAGNASF
jgi:phenylacetate-CoA ligase